MRIKAIIVAYAFSVQYFENATIVAYADWRVKSQTAVFLQGVIAFSISALLQVLILKAIMHIVWILKWLFSFIP